MTNEAMPRDPGARRTVGRLLGAGIVGAAIIAVIVALLQWQTRPQTDDATVRANLVGIAPQVSGPIVELHVRDNQQVQKGDLLFLIDPRPYEIALERARAARGVTGKEVDGLRNGAATAVAGVSRAAAQQTASAARVWYPPRDGSRGGRSRDRPAGGPASGGGSVSSAPRPSSSMPMTI